VGEWNCSCHPLVLPEIKIPARILSVVQGHNFWKEGGGEGRGWGT